MLFNQLAKYFQKLEETSSRLEITRLLSELFTKATPEEIDKICYLTQGRVAPLFTALEFGMAEKMVLKAVARTYNKSSEEVLKIYQKEGDLGKVVVVIARSIATKQSYRKNVEIATPRRNVGARNDVSIAQVFSILEEIALSSGVGSVEKKIVLLSDLLRKVDPLSARFLVRIPVAKMRLGFSDMTVLDALSWMKGDGKSLRPLIEKAFNVKPDLGAIAKLVKSLKVAEFKGLKIGPEIGTPILMARAERLSSGEEIIEKIGKCAIEPKLDGFRLQIHYGKIKMQKLKCKNKQIFSSNTSQNLKLFETQDTSEESVRLFTRNLEDVTLMYPDLVEAVLKQIKVKEAIFEGEAIGWDEKNLRYLPFQETVQRKRKYEIERMSKEVPLRLVVFDLLYVDGENLIEKPFLERRKRLEQIFH